MKYFFLELGGHKPKDRIFHNKRSLESVQKQLLHIMQHMKTNKTDSDDNKLNLNLESSFGSI